MSDDHRRARSWLTLVGVVLALTGMVAVGCGVASQEPAPPSPPAAGAEATNTEAAPAQDKDEPTTGPTSPKASAETGDPEQTDPADEPDSLALDWSQPVRVEIPKIGVSSTLEELEVDPEGAMEVPEDPDRAGWYTPAPPPGVPGVSVIAGHVTWNREPVVFFRLGDLRAGDKIRVQRADGVTAVFTIDRIGQFAKSTFPTKAVYTPTDEAEIRLITCGGEYDEESNRYLDNLIVWATMTSYDRA